MPGARDYEGPHPAGELLRSAGLRPLRLPGGAGPYQQRLLLPPGPVRLHRIQRRDDHEHPAPDQRGVHQAYPLRGLYLLSVKAPEKNPPALPLGIQFFQVLCRRFEHQLFLARALEVHLDQGVAPHGLDGQHRPFAEDAVLNPIPLA